MGLCGNIMEFLSGNALECRADKIAGQEVILAGQGGIIVPASLNADNVAKAQREAEKLRAAVGSIKEETGAYPLIVTEDRWHSQAHMMRARLLAHLHVYIQVYARNCEIRKIDKTTAAEFLAANHSYSDASCRYRYGLYLKRHTGHNAGTSAIPAGTLVAVATFSNARKWIKGDRTIRAYEWTRYASLPGVRLSGGMGKLLNTFIEEVKPDDIMTYADLEWSEGQVYETLGFELEGRKSPVTFAIDTSNWTRTALKSDGPTAGVGWRYFQNLGSNKYRLKLTDYQ